MAIFYYRARNASGEVTGGKVEAPTLAMAQQALEERGFDIVLLREVRKRLTLPFAAARIRTRDIVIFSRQLATLAEANVPLTDALKTLTRQTGNAELKRIISEIASEVESGTRLSLAFSRHPRVFNTFFVSMVKSGETAGRLSEVLTYLADQTEKEYDLTAKVRGAMIYPAFIVVGMIIVGVILLIFVIPQLTAVLMESGAQLPLMTRILIGVSSFAKAYWWTFLAIAAALAVGCRLALRNEGVRLKADRFKLRLPVLGLLFQKIILARLTRSLQILLSGGIDLVAALQVVGEVVGNSYYEGIIRKTQREVSDGNSITTVLAQSPLIPAMVPQMLAVGEETGQFVAVLEKLTNFYTREVDNSVTTLVSIIEPLLMIIIGVAVGIIVASIILPMYRLAGQF